MIDKNYNRYYLNNHNNNCSGKDKLKKTIKEINEKIEDGNAVVMTADELCDIVRNYGEDEVKVEDVDVVTAATRGLMSGTFNIFSINVEERNVFRKAKKISLNGIPGYAGPCPNERLGLVECIVYGTGVSEEKPNEYGGGHLFRDILEGKAIDCFIKTIEEKEIRKEITKDDIEFAKLVATRNSFKNYMAFTNKRNDSVKTIFHVKDFEGPLKEITVSGCGEINPLEKDPTFSAIGIGTKILINGAVGYVMGTGTRSYKARPNLSVFGKFLEMDPHYMGGFITSAGPEVVNSIAIPIPVLNEHILNQLKVIDKNVELPVGEIHDRVAFQTSDYSKVWQNVDLTIKADFDLCDQPRSLCIPWSEIKQRRRPCIILDICPMKPYMYNEENEFDLTNCYHCGSCLPCPENVFSANLGSIMIEDKLVPITLRQSDRYTALKLAEELKNKIIEKEFYLSEPLEKIKH
ncbi:MAG: methanogenesis marker 16 metalloprotein [Candidatus Lokiarchaeota archaeon]|nr:methanogenesis marker 16 metalloprotein [Candidatus Lokiarchaeota archaeon]